MHTIFALHSVTFTKSLKTIYFSYQVKSWQLRSMCDNLALHLYLNALHSYCYFCTNQTSFFLPLTCPRIYSAFSFQLLKQLLHWIGWITENLIINTTLCYVCINLSSVLYKFSSPNTSFIFFGFHLQWRDNFELYVERLQLLLNELNAETSSFYYLMVIGGIEIKTIPLHKLTWIFPL